MANLALTYKLLIVFLTKKEYIFSFTFKYLSHWDAFEAHPYANFSGFYITFSRGSREGYFISLDTFFDEFLAKKEDFVALEGKSIYLNDDYDRIVSALKNSIAP